MEIQTSNTQVCRLCLENENGGFLVEIFSSMINEPGKLSLSNKIRALFGLKIFQNDGLPSMVCHKCLVLTENVWDFREKCVKNDEKLRLIFKVEAVVEAQESEVVLENQPEAEQSDEEEEEVITLNPNKLYESSGESDIEPDEQTVADSNQMQMAAIKPPLPSVSKVNREKREIFHCRYCDIVFSDILSCTEHEQSHNSVYPYECAACSFKTDQHPTLIYHVKQTHNMEKPFFCTQCTKTFVRRSDLRKHTFVHAGIRLFSCDICKKSFTRNTNLTKHKRTHSEHSKNWKCSLCPKAFYSNSELLRHVEIHMDRKSFNCKHCNQAFVRRDQLEVHQKTHFENNSILQIEPPGQQINDQSQPSPIVFYNQPAEINVPHSSAPMNFYTENSSFNVNPIIDRSIQEIQPKKEYPIMNHLLSGMSHLNQNLAPIKSFVCGICNNSFIKKKEHDRHVMTVHTNIKQFHCDICSKTFNRKDKLLRHKKTHLAPPSVFNCSLCPAVFLRQHLLENHMKNHQLGNGENLESFLASLQPIASSNNGFVPIPSEPMLQVMEVTQPKQQTVTYQAEIPMSQSPMNLSVNKSDLEPINLSNDTMKVEPAIISAPIDSDDESNRLKIVEETATFKKLPTVNYFKNEPDVVQIGQDSYSERQCPMNIQENPPRVDEPVKQPENHEITFSMNRRIAELDKLEPLRDLPMEILNNE